VLVARNHVAKAVAGLGSRGFRVVVVEPFTVTLRRSGFIVDLYTYPAFAWIVYMDGWRLVRDYSEDFEVDGVWARCLTRDAEVVVAAAHAVYKEHIVLLLDCLTVKKWLSRKVLRLADEFMVRGSLDLVLAVCRGVEEGVVEAPYKIPLTRVVKLYLEKMREDPMFRGTSLNIVRYLLKRERSLYIVLSRLTRKTY